MQVSIIIPSWGLSVYGSLPETRLVLTGWERWILTNHGVILTLIHWLRPPFLTFVMQTHDINSE